MDKLCSKLASACYALRTLSKNVKSGTVITAYYGSFYPLLKYGIIFWGSRSNLSRVFIKQKMALRIIKQMKPLDSCRGVFRESKMLTAFAVCIFESIVFLKKHPDLFEKYLINHSYGTRGASLYYTYPVHSLTMTENDCNYSCIRYFNRLPKYIVCASNLQQFKTNLFNYLCQLEPYTLDEYLNYKGDVTVCH